jgi:diadenosine tetraphosphatase ApaH/serine/threonine PP2A family protein phosphatase
MHPRCSQRAIPEPGDYPAIRAWMMANDSGPVPERIVRSVILRLMGVLSCETNVLVLSAPINICGDIHGQFDDLLYIFQQAGAMLRNDIVAFHKQHFLFMGDYVDRGYHSLNTFLFLACLKLEFPGNIFLLRGNHESRQTSNRYGFAHEIVLNYGHSGLWGLCNDAFDLLPVAAICGDQVFCVHGGLSPKLLTVGGISRLRREVELPENGPLADLCWSDPENVEYWRQNARGAGYLFGRNEVRKFNYLNRFAFICRSHQLAQEGFVKHFCDEHGTYGLITVWSAPNYTYRANNKATIMKYSFSGRPIDELVEFGPNPDRIKPPQEEEAVGLTYFA